MRRTRTLRSATASCLLALLGALSTGLPSHHHDDAEAIGSELRFVGADHHSHGTQLVQQDDRTPSSLALLGAAPAVRFATSFPISTLVTLVESDTRRPTERAPPVGAPRAPPHPA